MGYQAIVAGFPIFLVIIMKAPTYVLGVAEALSYGVGAIFAFYGGKISDKAGLKKTAIIGNALIPILSFTGFAATVPEAVSLRVSGWWARNYRTPARRALFSGSVDQYNRSRAFGLLHALDVGGGLISTAILLTLLFYHWPLKFIFLVTIFPLTISTLLLLKIHTPESEIYAARPEVDKGGKSVKTGVLVATSLYGFSSFSLAFPILTVAEKTSNISLGIFSYAVFMAVSSFSGLIYGHKKIKKEVKVIGYLGYLLSALGSLGFVITLQFDQSYLFMFLSVALLGFALGSIETFEPTIISRVTPSNRSGAGMGYLSSARSTGLFMGNLLMGALFYFNAEYSYVYAFVVSLLAGVIMLSSGRAYERATST